MPLAWRFCDRLPIRSALIGLEVGSAILTAAVGFFVISGYDVLGFVLLALRGFVEMTTKSARGVAVRTLAPENTVSRANLQVNAGNFVGQTLGAVLGFWLICKS